MAQLVWDSVGERFFETAVSKGVFYDSEGNGVVWNGLTAVEEASPNTVEPVYFDGVKINDIVTLGDFSGIIRAWTYPDEFMPYEGVLEDQDGFFLTNQIPDRFGLCYRTQIGDDINGVDAGYKIHILYNLTAIPSQKVYQTLSLESAPHEFEWSITAIPEEIGKYRPTAHIVIDSRKIDPWLLADIEAILYGDVENSAKLPPLQGFATFIRKWNRFIIVDNGDGTWTAISQTPGEITLIGTDEFLIDVETAVYVDPDTYTIESSDKNEEDL